MNYINILEQAQCSSALSFSPQISIDPRLGSLLSDALISIPSAIEYIDDTHFRVNFFAPTANNVSLRTFDGVLPLQKDKVGIWTTVLENNNGGFRPLFFLVDGVSVLNPMAPVGFGASAAINFVDLPQANIDFYHLKNVPHGSVSQEFYFSSITSRYESCLVYTPSGYMRGNDAYPVLYLQHGHGENEHCWVHQGKINFIFDNLLAAQKAVPCIIVMNNGMVQQTIDTITRISPDLLSDIILADCIPFIERTYRTKSGRENRAMAGLSMGSLQTSMTVLSHPEFFAWAGIFSGFVQPLLGITKSSEYLNALNDAPQFISNFHLFFRAMGKADPFYSKFIDDSALLDAKNLSPDKCPAHIERIYSGSHDWNVWRMCARDFLQLIFR